MSCICNVLIVIFVLFIPFMLAVPPSSKLYLKSKMRLISVNYKNNLAHSKRLKWHCHPINNKDYFTTYFVVAGLSLVLV